jgi:hypothetical protein
MLTDPPIIQDDTATAISGIPYNCFQLGDKFYYIDTKNVKKEILYSVQNIFVDKEIRHGSDGIYSYIVGKTISDGVKLFAVRVLSNNEIGTKHSDIYSRVKDTYIKEIHYAGEFEKKGSTIVYNFISGTYMLDVVDPRTPSKNHTDNMDIVLSSLGFAPSFTSRVFIDPFNFELNTDYLRQLYSYGVEIYRYDTKEECERRKTYGMMLAKANLRHRVEMRLYEKYSHKDSRPPVFVTPTPPTEGKRIVYRPVEPCVYSACLSKKRKRTATSPTRVRVITSCCNG